MKLPNDPRQCGDCSVCCEVADVPGLVGPWQKCPYQNQNSSGSCSIFDSSTRPTICHDFGCAWYRGYGSLDDRPNNIDVMFSINTTEDGIFGFAIELIKDALISSAKSMAIEFASSIDVPIIAVAAGKKPPEDTGDWVIIKDALLPRAQRIIGQEIIRLSDDVAMYELVKVTI